MLQVDEIALVLSFAEAMLLLIAVPFYIRATYTICKETKLHVNFRLSLCMILFRTVLIALRRLPTLYWRVFIVGEGHLPFIRIYLGLSTATTNLLITTLLVMSLERVLHSNVKWFARSGLMSSVCLLTMLLASNGSLLIFRKFVTNFWISIGLLTIAPVLSFSLLLGVFRINLLRRNDQTDSSLDQKAEASKIMETVRTFVAPLLVSSLITVSLGLILIGQLICIPSGWAESRLDNIIGVVASLDALLTPALVLLCHKLFKNRFAKMIQKEIKQKSGHTDQYFKQIQHAWQ